MRPMRLFISMDKKSLDQIKYGSPSDKHVAGMNMETPLIGISFDQLSIKPPNKNSSQETLAELRSLFKSINDHSSDPHFIKIADEKPISVFESFANENNLKFDKEYFNQVKKELSSLILNLKYKFNRPRPSQICRVVGLNFGGLDLKTANTPSYPSGHAIQAHVIANILSRMYPKFERSLENLADQISLSRMQAGVHYPSDVAEGKNIANMIERYIENPHEAKGLALENDIRKITREFIRESYENSPEKLRVLDFDDTIANTAERVIITTADGGEKTISSKQFAVYDLAPGESINPKIAFREFDSVDSERASPVPLISDMLRSFAGAQGNRKLLILTARSQSVANDVMFFLEDVLGIENPSGKIDFIGVGSKDPQAKVEEIEKIMKKYPSINFVSFYDDSGKNVKAVDKFLDSLGFSKGRDQRDIRQVIHLPDGTVRLSRAEDEGDISESLNLRRMTRRFLMML